MSRYYNYNNNDYGRSSYYNNDYGRNYRGNNYDSRYDTSNKTGMQYAISYLSPQKYTLRIMLHINEDQDKTVTSNPTFIRTSKYDPLPFHPNLTTDQNLYQTGIIMFVPLVPFTKQDASDAMGSNPNLRLVFTTPSKYKKMLLNVTEKKPAMMVTEKDISNDTPKMKEVVKTNIDLIKDTFFSVNGTSSLFAKEKFFIGEGRFEKGILYIFGRKYVVTSCTYDPEKDIKHDKVDVGKILPDSYEVNFHLKIELATKENMKKDYSEADKDIPCNERARKIDKMSMELTGHTFGLSELEDNYNRTQINENLEKNKEAQAITHPKWLRFLANIQRDWASRNGKYGTSTTSTSSYNRTGYNREETDEDKFKKYVALLDRLEKQLLTFDKIWLMAIQKSRNKRGAVLAADEEFIKRKMGKSDNKSKLLKNSLIKQLDIWKTILNKMAEYEKKVKILKNNMKFKDARETLDKYYRELNKIQTYLRATESALRYSGYNIQQNVADQNKVNKLKEDEKNKFKDILTLEKKIDENSWQDNLQKQANKFNVDLNNLLYRNSSSSSSSSRSSTSSSSSSSSRRRRGGSGKSTRSFFKKSQQNKTKKNGK
jgi:hypothetical protein